MKSFIASFLLFLIAFTIPGSAAIGSKGLIIEGGKQTLTLKKGEKEYLNVADGFSKLPLFKGVSYYSDNTMVASIGLHSGILRANGIGTATITVINKNKDAGQIQIRVIHKKEKSYLFFLPLIIIGVFLMLFFLRLKL